MKLTTWNVNGLRAALKKGLLDWVRAYEPDVLCLQEIKARPEQLEAAHLEQLRALFQTWPGTRLPARATAGWLPWRAPRR